MQTVAKVRQAVTPESYMQRALGTSLVLLPRPLDRPTAMTTAEFMEAGIAYRYRDTPTSFYLRADVAADELRAKLSRKQNPAFVERVLLKALDEVPCPIVAVRVTRTADGEKRELCVIAASTPLRKLKTLPFA